MLRRFSVNFAIFSMLIDALLVDTALFLAVVFVPVIRASRAISSSLIGTAPYDVPEWAYTIFPAVWIITHLVFSVYDGRRNLRLVDELAALSLSAMIAMVSLSGLLYIASRATSRALFVAFAALAFLLILIVHVGYRIAFRLRAMPGIEVHHILILGAGVTGREMQKRILANESLGIKLVGFLDDDKEKRARDKSILGPLADTRRVVLMRHVEEVVVALPSYAFERINQIIADLHSLPVKVRIIPDYYNLALAKARIEDVAGIPLMDLRAPALNDYQLMVKRLFDIAVVLVTMPIALPVMGLVALAIWIDDPGPILFRQTRIGENGRPFTMLKFRSMVINAEKQHHLIEQVDANGHIIQDKKRHDPRITRVGRFIRRTSLDELPQLFNVLLGSMSLVGPRPELPYLVEQYEPWQRSRFAVPQGITGWWQVNGRSDKPMHQHTDEDLFYVHNYSIWLDLQILIKTFWTIIHHNGAY